MAVINFARREIITKIVYFGAPGAGTTSNLRTLYVAVRGTPQGGLLPFGPVEESEQTLFFEVLPEGYEVPGFALRLRVYSLPGGLADRVHREEILRDVDAVVFVSDARPGRTEANIDALLDLDGLLKDLGMDLGTLPMVFQVNHTDHPEAEPTEEVVYDLNPYGCPVIEARARGGDGVGETLELLLDGIVARVRDNLAGQPNTLSVHAIHRREVVTAEEVVEAHERAIALARAELGTQEQEDPRAAWSRSRYDILPAGLTVEVPYQPPQLAGMRPVHVLDSRIQNDRVHLDVVLDDAEGAHPTRLRVSLIPPDARTTPTATGRYTAGTVPAVPERQEITAVLPDRIELVQAPAAPDTTMAVWYGILGAVAGIVAGVLAGFLLWA